MKYCNRAIMDKMIRQYNQSNKTNIPETKEIQADSYKIGRNIAEKVFIDFPTFPEGTRCHPDNPIETNFHAHCFGQWSKREGIKDKIKIGEDYYDYNKVGDEIDSSKCLFDQVLSFQVATISNVISEVWSKHIQTEDTSAIPIKTPKIKTIKS